MYNNKKFYTKLTTERGGKVEIVFSVFIFVLHFEICKSKVNVVILKESVLFSQKQTQNVEENGRVLVVLFFKNKTSTLAQYWKKFL